MTDKIFGNPLCIFHFDMNFVSLRNDYLRKWLTRLAAIGYNAILWEIEDKVKLDTLGEIAYAEAMSKAEFRELLDYSIQLGLEPIPLVQTFGHGEYIMKHEKYRCFREQDDYCDCYCASNSEVKNFLTALLNEVSDLFGNTRFFHLGGDEAYVFGTCEKCKAYSDKYSRNRLYADHLSYLGNPLKERGIRPGIWSDMILHYPDDTGSISKDYLIWDWNYWDGINEPETTIVWGYHKQCTAAEIPHKTLQLMPEILDDNGKLTPFYTVDVLTRLGFDVVLCSSSRASGDTIFCGKHQVHAPNIVGASRAVKNKKLLGHCVTSWAVRIFNYELQENWLALACLEDDNLFMDFDKLLEKQGRLYFNTDPTDFYNAISLIASVFPIAVSGKAHTSGIQWSGFKDSVPAPANYLKETLENWKNNAPQHYATMKQMLEKSLKEIPAGKMLLEKFAYSTGTNHVLISQWLKAANFQLRLQNIVRQVFSFFENKPQDRIGDIVSDVNKLRKDYENYAKEWMTPQCAYETAKLIFEPILNFFPT